MTFNWIAFLPLIILMCYIIWRIWFNKKDPKITHFSEDWRVLLNRKVSFYRKLVPAEKLRFEKEILYFFEATAITGVDLEITDVDRLLVASSAVIPLFGFPELRYRNINEVLLYGDSFNNDNQTEGSDRHILGKVGSGTMNRLMILSLPALHAGFEQKNSRSNVGIHEFVHLIDKADGVTDGLPESLTNKEFTAPWLRAIHREIVNMTQGQSDINPYGATTEVEFLSVASEYFFNQPEVFKEKHTELYELMTKMYRQRP